MATIEPPDLDIRFPFTRATGLHAGLSDRELNGPAYRRLLRGTYLRRDVIPSHAMWVRAGQLLVPAESFASHHSAARLLGGIVPQTATVHLGTTHRLASRHLQLRLHRYASRPPTVLRDGVHCTDAVRSFLDLAPLLDLVDLVVLGDSLVASDALALAELRAGVTRGSSAGVRRARQAARLVRERVESPTETRVRLLLVLAGLPEPVVNLTVQVGAGGRCFRLDLSWPEVKVAVEYDGRYHVDLPGQAEADRTRREQLAGDGWRIVVLTADDLYVAPRATLDRVTDVLQGAGMPVGRRRCEWERHFAGRPSVTVAS